MDHIVQTTFQDSAVGEENISWQSETGTNLSLGAASKNLGNSDCAHCYGVWDQTKTTERDK